MKQNYIILAVLLLAACSNGAEKAANAEASVDGSAKPGVTETVKKENEVYATAGSSAAADAMVSNGSITNSGQLTSDNNGISNSTATIDGTTAATAKANDAVFNGIIMIAPEQCATISATIGGKIHSSPILPGQFVKKGSLLVTLENPEFIDLQQAYLEAGAQTEYLEQEYKRQERLSREEAASQKRFQQSKAEYLAMKSRLDAAATQLRLLGVDPTTLTSQGIIPYLELRSPISGYVSEIDFNLGKYMQAGEPICEVVDKGEPLICLTAYEKDLQNLQPGKPVQFRVNGMDGQLFEATLITVGQKVDETSRSLNVYARVKQNHPAFRPGMYVSANLQK